MIRFTRTITPPGGRKSHENANLSADIRRSGSWNEDLYPCENPWPAGRQGESRPLNIDVGGGQHAGREQMEKWEFTRIADPRKSICGAIKE